VARSLSLDSSLDSKHLQASLRISQNRMSEACDVLEEIYRGIKQNREMLARRTVIEELSAPVNPNPEDDGQEASLLSLPSLSSHLPIRDLQRRAVHHHRENVD
jgi:hypothetical protein